MLTRLNEVPTIHSVFNNASTNIMGSHIRRDTKAWTVQTWLSFLTAVFLCATGLAWLPGSTMEQAFMVMAYVFSLSAVFVVSKFVRDRDANLNETPMWGWVVWSGFAMAVALTGWGMWNMPVSPNYKAYLLVAWLFMLSSAFTLAKTLRDAYEADLQEKAHRVRMPVDVQA